MGLFIYIFSGYKYTFPFLTSQCGIKIIGNRVHPLYKQVININQPTMSLIGIPFRVCPFPMFDVQVRRCTNQNSSKPSYCTFQVNFFLETLTGRFVLPSKEKMLEDLQREIDEKREKGVPEKHFHLVGLGQEEYFNDLADTAGIKRVPPVVCKIYCYVTGSRNLDDCFEIINENEYRKL